MRISNETIKRIITVKEDSRETKLKCMDNPKKNDYYYYNAGWQAALEWVLEIIKEEAK